MLISQYMAFKLTKNKKMKEVLQKNGEYKKAGRDHRISENA